MSRVYVRRPCLYVVVAIWLASVSAGLGILLRYANTPGEAAVPPARWPDDSHITWHDGWPKLLIFAHPHCPCTKASLRELELIMARCHRQVRAHVLFIQPEGVGPSWLDGDLWEMATRIPGVDVYADPEGREAARFQAVTSGQTLLYAANGTLTFCGGITSARGHVGDNVGRDAVIRQLVGAADESSRHREVSLVFGCPLQSVDTIDSDEASQ